MNDDELDVRDVLLFLVAVKAGKSLADFNVDGDVNRADLRAFLRLFKICVVVDDGDDD